MTTNVKIGYGAIIELDSNGAGSWVTVGEVTDLTPANISADAVDATHNASPGAAKEFIVGLLDYGEIKAEMNFVADSATDQLIRDLMVARDLVNWRITLPPIPDSPSHMETGSGVITGYEREAPVDDKMAATLTIKVSGPVNYAT